MLATIRTTDCLRRTAGVLLGLLAAVSVGLAQGPGSKPLVADVVPLGNSQIPTQKIKNIIKTRAGVEYSKDTVQADVRALYETKMFANVRSEEEYTPDGRVIVKFKVVEYPSLVQDIVYNGVQHIKQDELDSLTGLKKGTPLNPTANQAARQAILRRYQELGRMFASVDLVEGDKPGDTRIVFNVTEGPKVKVNKIEITGNTFVTVGRLKTQVKSSAQFAHLFGGDFNPLLADLDVQALEDYYRTYGFHDVHVSRELKWSEDQRYVTLIFHVHEGQRYRIAGIDVTGNKHFDREELLALSRLKQGEFFDDNVVKADVANIQDKFGYVGRQAVVRAQHVFKEPGEVLVQYEVQERPPARVGQVKVIGNDITRQNVILRQVPLFPGQILSYPDLRVAERNLARLNIFEANAENGIRPTVFVEDPEGDNEFKDVIVQVQETPTGSLLFGVGVNSDAGLTGSVVLNERNFDILHPPTSFEELLSGRAFRGGGQEFRLEAVPGTTLQRYTISLREPFLFDSLFSLGVSGYYYTRRYNEYDETRLGGRVTLGRKLNQYWSVNGAVRLEDVGVHNVVDIPGFTPTDLTSAIGNHFICGLRGGFTRDARDSYLRPTEGSLIDIAYEQVVGDYNFPLLSLEANKYFTIYQRADGSGRHVLAARSQVAWAGSQTPVFERFYAGGFRTLRGFEFRGVGPDVNGFMVGGDFMWLNSLEYQIPILANDQLYAVGFIDSGTVEPNAEIKNYRVTAGVGLRVVVPMLGPVPIALDFGVPLNKADTDRTQIFSFWVGFFH